MPDTVFSMAFSFSYSPEGTITAITFESAKVSLILCMASRLSEYTISVMDVSENAYSVFLE